MDTHRGTLVEPPTYCTSSTPAASICVALKGWPEGLVTSAEWLDNGGPLDATDHLPIGGAYNHDLSFTTLRRFSQARPGAAA